jgi:hypothetical protein
MTDSVYAHNVRTIAHMRKIDVYVNRRPVVQTYLEGHSLWSEVSYKAVRPRVKHRGDCDHPEIIRAFAYDEWMNEHWPIRFCDECLRILSGREPRPGFDPHDPVSELIAAKWSREWPKPGKPRTFKPRADLAWPDAA